MSHSLSSVVYQAYLQVTPSLTAIPCGTRPISSDLGSQPASGLVSTCPGDRLGIPGAVSFFFFFSFFHLADWTGNRCLSTVCQMEPFLERKMLPPAISLHHAVKRGTRVCVCVHIYFVFFNTVEEGAPFPAALQCRVDAWSEWSKPPFQLLCPKIRLICSRHIGDISDIKLIRTDTTLDLSQKAEKR